MLEFSYDSLPCIVKSISTKIETNVFSSSSYHCACDRRKKSSSKRNCLFDATRALFCAVDPTQMVFASASASAPRQRTYDAAYRSILAARRRSPSASAASVVMLVAPEVDALCAARMLSALFKQDDVPYRIIPVASFQGLTDIRDELMQHAEVRESGAF